MKIFFDNTKSPINAAKLKVKLIKCLIPISFPGKIFISKSAIKKCAENQGIDTDSIKKEIDDVKEKMDDLEKKKKRKF